MRRIVRLAVVLACLGVAVAGCGEEDGGGGPATYGDAGATTTSGPDTGASGDDGAPATTVTSGGGDAPATPTTGRRPGGATATTLDSPGTGEGGTGGDRETAASTTTVRADDGSLGPPGAFARTLLRPTPATAIVVERFHQRGAEPEAATIAFASDTLRRVTEKPVDVRASIGVAGGASSWTADEIRAVADGQSQVAQGVGGRAVLRVLFLRGSFEGNDSVLGVAVRGDTVAVFSDSVEGATTPVLSGAAIEEAVLVHELGHVLGLVDLARDTGRADPEHPGHSPNARSVMYWAVESDLIGQVLAGPPPREFDAADLADLRALRDGAE